MKWTAGKLAKAIAARLEGDGALEITGVAAPERAGAKQLIYVEAAKHAEAGGGFRVEVAWWRRRNRFAGENGFCRRGRARWHSPKRRRLLLERAPYCYGNSSDPAIVGALGADWR